MTLSRIKFCTLLVLLFFPSLGEGWGEAFAQHEQPAPKWVAKTCKAIVSVLTYDQQNELLHSGTGAFISQDGIGVSDYALWRDAYRAVVVDMDGKSYDVERILGADDMYGAVRFRVAARKVNHLSVAPAAASAEGQTVHVLTFQKKAPVSCPELTIEKKELVDGGYAYFTLSRVLDSKYSGGLLFTETGDFVGIVQSPVGNRSYAVDSRLAAALQIEAIQTKTGAIALQNIHLPGGLPDSQEEALVYLYFKSRSAGNEEYMDLLNLFLTTWPDCAEGYLRRATPLMDLQRFEEADSDLKTYLRLAADKAQAEANVAQSIYTKLTYQSDVPYAAWSYDTALDHVDRALSLTTDSVQQLSYQLQKAQILMAKPDARGALAIYDRLNSGPYRSPSLLYAASLAHAQLGDSATVQIALLDSALTMFSTPLPEEAANYFMRRGQLHASSGHFRQAVQDYNQYCYLKNNRVSAVFYYERSQLEVEGRMYQQALDDLDAAIGKAPGEALYHMEKSAVLLRVGETEQCIESARHALLLDPNMSDAHRILGYALIQSGQKAEGRRSLERAIELGDETAQELIDKYAK